VDAVGATYQRMFPTLFHAELVEVHPAGSVDQIAPGQERAVEFIVRNAGPAADYRILAVTTQRITTRAEPAVLQIPAGGERRISVSLSTPPDMDPGTTFDLIVTASASSPRPTTNSAIVHLTIATREAR
jgi:hypothetical protein